MTNAMIILVESVKLMEEGILSGTGQFITVEDSEGNKKQYEQPEQIHTYQTWKSMGYQVKKGEKAIAQFPIWKHTTKTVENKETGENEETSNMFMKVSSFFKISQVEKVVVK